VRSWVAGTLLACRALASGALAAAIVAAASPAAVPWHLAVFGVVLSGTLAALYGRTADVGRQIRRFFIHAGSMSAGFGRLRFLPLHRRV
jgi:hypothetical protein